MKQTIRTLFAFIFVLSANVCFAPGAAADSPVTLRGEVKISRATVRLSDVFAGVPDTIDREIAQAPQPGQRVVYDITVLNRLTQLYRLDWQAQSQADRAVIVEDCTPITADAIRAAVIDKVKEEGTKGDIEITFDNRALGVNLPAGQSSDFTLNNFQYDSIDKRFHADLVTLSSASTLTLPVTGRVTVKRDVPVLAKRLEGGTTIGSNDLDMRSVTDDHITPDTVTEISQLVGRELRRDTAEGETIRTHDIIPPRFVTRGSLVTLKIETPFMQVTSQGKALQDGTAGDVVRVLNTQSNRTIEGTVESPGVVRIHSTQKFAAVESDAGVVK